MQPAQMLSQLGVQLELLRASAELAPLNQGQLERMNAIQDRILDLMEQRLDNALAPPEVPETAQPIQEARPSAPGITTLRVSAPQASDSPSPSTGDSAPFPFRTTGHQHISELIQAILPPAIGRGLSFDELSQGVKRVLTDSPEVKTQRPPPGTMLELGGLLRSFEVDPGLLPIEPTVS